MEKILKLNDVKGVSSTIYWGDLSEDFESKFDLILDTEIDFNSYKEFRNTILEFCIEPDSNVAYKLVGDFEAIYISVKLKAGLHPDCMISILDKSVQFIWTEILNKKIDRKPNIAMIGFGGKFVDKLSNIIYSPLKETSVVPEAPKYKSSKENTVVQEESAQVIESLKEESQEQVVNESLSDVVVVKESSAEVQDVVDSLNAELASKESDETEITEDFNEIGEVDSDDLDAI